MAEPAPWPRYCADPATVLEWLGELRPADDVGKRAVFTLRWLLNVELERQHPGPGPASITDFTPEDLTSGQ